MPERERSLPQRRKIQNISEATNLPHSNNLCAALKGDPRPFGRGLVTAVDGLESHRFPGEEGLVCLASQGNWRVLIRWLKYEQRER
jgi:hypothetical protein